MPNCSFPFIYSIISSGLEECVLGFTQVSHNSGALTLKSAPSLWLWTDLVFACSKVLYFLHFGVLALDFFFFINNSCWVDFVWTAVALRCCLRLMVATIQQQSAGLTSLRLLGTEREEKHLYSLGAKICTFVSHPHQAMGKTVTGSVFIILWSNQKLSHRRRWFTSCESAAHS